MPEENKTVALFATCLVDAFRPGVATAAKRLLGRAGFRVETPKAVTCCGQVAHNSGDLRGARKLAQHHVDLLAAFDYVAVPSGSCAGMIKNQYPSLFEQGTPARNGAETLAAKTFELTSFLVHVGKPVRTPAGPAAKFAIHDSCSCLRELGIRDEPRTLLAGLKGAEVVEIAQAERCCGFGGLFSVKFSEISDHLADQKIKAVVDAGAEVLTGPDLGCLLNLEGRLKKKDSAIEVRHIAEVLAEGLEDEN